MKEHSQQDKLTVQAELDQTAAGAQRGLPSKDGLDPPQPEEHVVSTESAVVSLVTPDDASLEISTEDLRTAPPAAKTKELKESDESVKPG